MMYLELQIIVHAIAIFDETRQQLDEQLCRNSHWFRPVIFLFSVI